MRSLAETIHGEVTVYDPRAGFSVRGRTIVEANHERRRLSGVSTVPAFSADLGAGRAGPAMAPPAGPASFVRLRGPP